jgi:ParB/RepB/Spo0J family partition protein
MQILVLDPKKIVVPAERQRKELGDLAELSASIKEIGQIQPIVVHEEAPNEFVLVAGERRLRACIFLGKNVFATRLEDLPPIVRQMIELEENIKRKDLTWQERVNAIEKIHRLHLEQDPTWTQQKTADSIGIDHTSVSSALSVAAALPNNKLVQNASGFGVAKNLVQRQRSRATASLLDSLLDKEETVEPTANPIIQGDFLALAESYSGPKFNLIHCDFPYGIGLGGKQLQNTRKDLPHYQDSTEGYWDLVACLVRNIDKLASGEAHILFWFSMNHYTETLNALSSIGAVNPFPLIWMKSDNLGLLPDAQRGPRRIYESAFLVSRGDRKVVKAVSNAYGAPSERNDEAHLSEKPLSVLLKFLPMLVDGTTKLLDPTAGSGTALIAAKKLGASFVRGWEINQDFVDMANKKFWRES